VFCLSTLSAVLSQTAGGAQTAAFFIGSTPDLPPQRYISIPQSSLHEWEQLGSTFTIETWVWMEAPPSNSTGAWSGSADEIRFPSLVSRHPGNGLQNEWAHFNLQLTRTTTGATVVFWAGCGCDGAPSSTPANPETCGFGYLLSSDSSRIAPNQRFWLRPREWHHISISVDGDSLTQGVSSGVARLTIDGQLLLENHWGSKDNIPPYLTSNPCLGKQIYSRTIPGTSNEAIHLGYYDNSDSDATSDDNTALVSGFDGYLDELRVWSYARTPSEVADTFALTLPPQQGLVGLYNFNGFSAPHTYPNLAAFGGIPAAMVQGPRNNDTLISDNNGLMLAQLVIVPGSLPDMDPMNVEFNLRGSSAQGYFVSVFSAALIDAINAGKVQIAYKSRQILPDQLPVEVSTDPLVVVYNCDDTQCINTWGAPSDVWFSYSSIEEPKLFSQVFLDLEEPCPEGFDACGQCGGDNRTCQCVIYHEFRNTRMAYILLTWSLEKIVEKLDTTIEILIQIESIVKSPEFDDDLLRGNYTLSAEVNYMMDFYNLCLTDYCADVTEFTEMLDAYLLSVIPSQHPPPVRRVASNNVQSFKSAYTPAFV